MSFEAPRRLVIRRERKGGAFGENTSSKEPASKLGGGKATREFGRSGDNEGRKGFRWIAWRISNISRLEKIFGDDRLRPKRAQQKRRKEILSQIK